MNLADPAGVAESKDARDVSVGPARDLAERRLAKPKPDAGGGEDAVGNRIVAYLHRNGSASVDQILHGVAPAGFADVTRSLDGLREIGFVDIIGRGRDVRLRLTPGGEVVSQLMA